MNVRRLSASNITTTEKPSEKPRRSRVSSSSSESIPSLSHQPSPHSRIRLYPIRNMKKYRVPMGILGFLVICIIIAILTYPYFSTRFLSSPNHTAGENLIPTTALPPLTASAFSISDLVAQDIDGLQKKIGPSLDTEPENLPSSMKTWRLTFRNGKQELIATYDRKTGEVTSLFLPTDDPSGKTTDTKRLLKLGGVTEKANTYDVIYVKTAENPHYFTGIKILSK